MKKILLASIAAAALCGAPAVAADIPTKAPAYVGVAAYDWSGFYFGVHSGFARAPFDAAFVSGIPNFKVNHDSAIFGGQIGYQHQFGNFVLGIEGSLSISLQQSLASTDCPPPNNVAFNCAARLQNVLTVGPRLGWAMGMWMPYVTGGYARASFTEQISLKAAPNTAWTDSHQHKGWFVGGGVDWALSRGLMIGLEYRHYDFGSALYVPANGTGPLGGASNSGDVSADTVTLRVSVKFGSPQFSAPPK